MSFFLYESVSLLVFVKYYSMLKGKASYQLENLPKEKEKRTVNHDLDGPCLKQQNISKAQCL